MNLAACRWRGAEQRLLFQFRKSSFEACVVGSLVRSANNIAHSWSECDAVKSPKVFGHVGFSVVKPAHHKVVFDALFAGEVIGVSHEGEEVFEAASIRAVSRFRNRNLFGFNHNEGF